MRMPSEGSIAAVALVVLVAGAPFAAGFETVPSAQVAAEEAALRDAVSLREQRVAELAAAEAAAREQAEREAEEQRLEEERQRAIAAAPAQCDAAYDDLVARRAPGAVTETRQEWVAACVALSIDERDDQLQALVAEPLWVDVVAADQQLILDMFAEDARLVQERGAAGAWTEAVLADAFRTARNAHPMYDVCGDLEADRIARDWDESINWTFIEVAYEVDASSFRAKPGWELYGQVPEGRVYDFRIRLRKRAEADGYPPGIVDRTSRLHAAVVDGRAHVFPVLDSGECPALRP